LQTEQRSVRHKSMSNSTTTPTPRPKIGAVAFCSDKPVRIEWIAVASDIVLAEGEFVIKSKQGRRTIGRFTGRTRRFFGGVECPTIERRQVDTVVIDGAVCGRAGALVQGTYAIHPERVYAIHPEMVTV